MQEALYVKGSQEDTEWNSAMREQLCLHYGANPPQDKEKSKSVGIRRVEYRRGKAAVKQRPA